MGVLPKSYGQGFLYLLEVKALEKPTSVPSVISSLAQQTVTSLVYPEPKSRGSHLKMT